MTSLEEILHRFIAKFSHVLNDENVETGKPSFSNGYHLETLKDGMPFRKFKTLKELVELAMEKGRRYTLWKHP